MYNNQQKTLTISNEPEIRVKNTSAESKDNSKTWSLESELKLEKTKLKRINDKNINNGSVRSETER